MLISLILVITIVSEMCTTEKDFSSDVMGDTQPAWRGVFGLVGYEHHSQRPNGSKYVANSISKLQILVATYVFYLSAGNCHR
jgi:hypothetical protein